MIGLVLRYWTDTATCVRHWFWVANTHAPERASLAVACTRAAPFVAPAVGVVGAPRAVIGIPITEQDQRVSTDVGNPIAAEINRLGETLSLPREEGAARVVALPTARVGSKWQAVGGSPTPEIARTLPGIDTATLQIPATVPPIAPSAPIPEPATLALLGAAFLAAGIVQAMQGRAAVSVSDADKAEARNLGGKIMRSGDAGWKRVNALQRAGLLRVRPIDKHAAELMATNQAFSNS